MRPFVVFDTECATSKGPPHLVEVGAVRVVDGEIVGHFEELVRPEVAIEKEAFEVHGIEEAAVRDARTAAEVLPDFARFIGGDWLFAHGASRDVGLLGWESARHDIDLPANAVLDTLKLARHCAPDASDHTLETLAGHFEVDVDRSHRALADAVTCWKVLEACIELLAVEPGTDGGGDRIATEILHRAGTKLTLAGARPRMPRLSPRLRSLESACRERTRVTLLYGEDSGPSKLLVAPRVLFSMGEKSYLEGECVRSGTIKTYRLDRIQRVLDA
jgi:DNA polymerase III epsilon subunit family exonuclease